MLQQLGPDDPRLLGRYQIIGCLGAGGMGQVYLARSPGARLVAVKVIHSELLRDPDFLARFGREVTAARKVSGVFTAQVVDADTVGKPPWLATAFIRGPSLADAVAENGPLPPGALLDLAAGLAEGLSVIHEAGVVHRDLKPSNVLLSEEGPLVIDFGIARAAEVSAVTRTGMVVGSPGFMSPEQALGHQVGKETDVFSLGAVLVYAAKADGPFGSGSVPSLLYRVVHSEPDLTGVPPEIADLAARCLAKDPANRPETAEILSLAAQGRRSGTRLENWLPYAEYKARIQASIQSFEAGVRMPTAVVSPGGEADVRPVSSGPPTESAITPPAFRQAPGRSPSDRSPSAQPRSALPVTPLDPTPRETPPAWPPVAPDRPAVKRPPAPTAIKTATGILGVDAALCGIVAVAFVIISARQHLAVLAGLNSSFPALVVLLAFLTILIGRSASAIGVGWNWARLATTVQISISYPGLAAILTFAPTGLWRLPGLAILTASGVTVIYCLWRSDSGRYLRLATDHNLASAPRSRIARVAGVPAYFYLQQKVERPRTPRLILPAVIVLYIQSALFVLLGSIYAVLGLLALVNAISQHNTISLRIVAAIGGVILALPCIGALLAWVARSVVAGRRWASIFLTAEIALWVVPLGTGAPVVRVLGIFLTIPTLVAAVLLWLRPSRAYVRQRAAIREAERQFASGYYRTPGGG